MCPASPISENEKTDDAEQEAQIAALRSDLQIAVAENDVVKLSEVAQEAAILAQVNPNAKVIANAANKKLQEALAERGLIVEQQSKQYLTLSQPEQAVLACFTPEEERLLGSMAGNQQAQHAYIAVKKHSLTDEQRRTIHESSQQTEFAQMEELTKQLDVLEEYELEELNRQGKGDKSADVSAAFDRTRAKVKEVQVLSSNIAAGSRHSDPKMSPIVEKELQPRLEKAREELRKSLQKDIIDHALLGKEQTVSQNVAQSLPGIQGGEHVSWTRDTQFSPPPISGADQVIAAQRAADRLAQQGIY